ncbi:hypothetical protein L6E12_16640 [Actinokineospora sp. PR83]|uniref:hypothetical protein n=1 Tax=Actinokineospora sp. PR83 TaxID=2884908 RepID=UPI001F44A7DC|nr:hypothetical protein [Actinokineospora sp. PR83]MCG8917415.1 hypothetical protein [Actinokineospora sp. PR83]
MSEVEHGAVGAVLRAFLAQEGELPAGRVLTHAVIVFRTYEVREDGRAVTRRGRVYPLGEMDATLERGMLDDALFDARRDRGRPG